MATHSVSAKGTAIAARVHLSPETAAKLSSEQLRELGIAALANPQSTYAYSSEGKAIAGDILISRTRSDPSATTASTPTTTTAATHTAISEQGEARAVAVDLKGSDKPKLEGRDLFLALKAALSSTTSSYASGTSATAGAFHS